MKTPPDKQRSIEHDNTDNALRDDRKQQHNAGPERDAGDEQRNPDNVKDGSAQDGTQPLAGA